MPLCPQGPSPHDITDSNITQLLKPKLLRVVYTPA